MLLVPPVRCTQIQKHGIGNLLRIKPLIGGAAAEEEEEEALAGTWEDRLEQEEEEGAREECRRPGPSWQHLRLHFVLPRAEPPPLWCGGSRVRRRGSGPSNGQG